MYISLLSQKVYPEVATELDQATSPDMDLRGKVPC